MNTNLSLYRRSALAGGLAAWLFAMVLHAAPTGDMPYSTVPLFWANGVPPNVALLIDNSGSMTATDTGGVAGSTITSVCDGTTTLTLPLSRIDAVKEAACQVTIDNGSSMRIGLYSFANSTKGGTCSSGGSCATQVLPFVYNNAANLETSILTLNANQYTPLSSAMSYVMSDFAGVGKDDSPIQYRCQKNYVVLFTDGLPNVGQDSNSTLTLPSVSPAVKSTWVNALLTGTPGWDGFPDPKFNGGGGASVYPWLDEFTQWAYDVDLRTGTSTNATNLCGASATVPTPAAGFDCSGKSWDAIDFRTQNVVTYTVGYGSEADNEYLRNPVLNNLLAFDKNSVFPAASGVHPADTFYFPNHGRLTGDWVHVYNTSHATVTVTGLGNTVSDAVTASPNNTSVLTNGALLNYDDTGGTTLQYLAAPAQAAQTCGAIGGLTPGNSYYIAIVDPDHYQFATTLQNAYNCDVLNTNCIDLTSSGNVNTTHQFDMAPVAADTVTFTANTSGTSPLNTTTNYEDIISAGHGLSTGDIVTYTACSFGCAINGLTRNSNYYVAKVDANTFRLATTLAKALTCASAADNTAAVSANCINLGYPGSKATETFTRSAQAAKTDSFTATGNGTLPVNTIGDVISSVSHGFNTGDLVKYTCTGFAGTPAVYSTSTQYFATAVNTAAGTFKLALTATDAANGVFVDISNGGNASQTFTFNNTAVTTLPAGLYAYETDGTALKEQVSAISNTGTTSAVRTFTVASVAGWSTSNPITFQNDSTQTPYASISLVDGQDYYPININTASNTFQISATANGTALATTCNNGGKQSCLSAPLPFSFYAYPQPATTSADRGKYWIAKIDKDHIKLALTKNEATSCAASGTRCVDITSTGQGSLSDGPGRAFYASSKDQLSDALNSAFASIKSDTLSQASLAANTSQLGGGAYLYQASFNTADWSGDIKAFDVSSGSVNLSSPTWQASTSGRVTVGDTRKLFTWDNTASSGQGKSLNFPASGTTTGLNATQLKSLDPATGNPTAGAVVSWIRGTDGSLRARNNSLYGDILNGSPIYVGPPSRSPTAAQTTAVSEYSSYSTFKSTYSSRTPALYVGANDGMLHGVDTGTGNELFGYIPGGVYYDFTDLNSDVVWQAGETEQFKFNDLAQPGYGLLSGQAHDYFVDGQPNSADAYWGGAWHTVVVGGLGKGGRTVYALDVTNPSTMTYSNVLWEFGNGRTGCTASAPYVANCMGYSFSRPVIARLATGDWAAIFGNGYDSAGDVSRLFIVRLSDGAIINQLVVAGTGLSSVSVRNGTDVSGNDNGIAKIVYAGDLNGTVWRFDISSSTVSSWSSIALFKATDGTNPQPITSAITLGDNTVQSNKGKMLYFGTGRYFTDTDKNYTYGTSTPVYDSIYGLWDDDSATPTNPNITLSQLQQQTLTNSITVPGQRNLTTSPVSSYTGSGVGSRGWYINLYVGSTYEGERVVFAPLLVNKVLFLTTVVPNNSDPCSGGGTSWIYGMLAISGTQASIFDFNKDGTYDAAAGAQSNDGVYSQVAYLTNSSDPNSGTVYTSASDGTIININNTNCPGCTSPSLKSGRMTWRQLQ